MISDAGLIAESEPASGEPTPLPTIVINFAGSAIPLAEAGLVEGDTSSLPHVYQAGLSEDGRPILLWRFGSGAHLLTLIGGIHGAYEANTVALAELLVAHFQTHPAALYGNLTLDIIPVVNPDGYALSDRVAGRYNSRGVDLNRNWGCEWSPEAYFHNRLVNPGTEPFSEAETRVMADYALEQEPAVVIFYHSAADGVFLGACGDSPAPRYLGKLLEDATGYPYGTFSAYPVTGDATNWLVEQGIDAAVIELKTASSPEFERNLAGVMALQCHFANLDRGANPGDSESLAFLRLFCGEPADD